MHLFLKKIYIYIREKNEKNAFKDHKKEQTSNLGMSIIKSLRVIAHDTLVIIPLARRQQL